MIQYMIADGEAEKLCSYLCMRGIVDAVVSEDSDVLVYGTPVFIFRINLSKNSSTIIKMSELLDNLSMTLLQFQDFCILCGCDYNSRIKIKSKNNKRDSGIGVTKAYNLIKKYKTLEVIKEKECYDLTSLNYTNCRKIFTFLEEKNVYNIQHNNITQIINYDILEDFLVKYKCNFNINKWKKVNNANLFIDIFSKIERLKIE